MSNQVMIQTHNLGKRYRITRQTRTEAIHYRTLREDVMALVRQPFARQAASTQTTLWALRDVSLQVQRGEIVGVIGRNGAGKSTLLKILARITRPTTGSADLYGRLGSLLEIGTGFHGELTGRENVFLSGAVLGMRRAEIRQRFDEIVAFAEIDSFIDTPVKRYSSGMYMRLAFAVAAHLDTEILLVDEVLAVGDSAFQRKCLGKMSSVAQTGRTVLFVSHNMVAVRNLCARTLYLAHGRIVGDGPTQKIVTSYLAADNDHSSTVDLTTWHGERTQPGPYHLTSAYTRKVDGTRTSHFAHGEPLIIGMTTTGRAGQACQIGVSLRDMLGNIIVHLKNMDEHQDVILNAGETRIEIQINTVFNEGVYALTLWFGDSLGHLFDRAGNCLHITVDASQVIGSGKNYGFVLVPATWSITEG
ncbi:MAG: ABC transporter ATP-binding protein [Anaerolineae bacterium]|nr:ABC transporter ATP-binding protein [Anaerolineae bacterium]